MYAFRATAACVADARGLNTNAASVLALALVSAGAFAAVVFMRSVLLFVPIIGSF